MSNTKNNNYQGVQLGKTSRDYILGSQVSLEINCEDWGLHLVDSKWKIEHEKQQPFGFETYACTCYSGNDVKEMIMMNALKNKLIPPTYVRWLADKGYFKNGAINFDDRIPAMHSEIIEGIGTYQWKAGNALRQWSLPEGILKDKPKNFKEYIDKSKINQEAIDLQKEYDKRFIWHWFWFNNIDSIDEQMKMSPAMSVVSFANGDECLKPSTPFNHAVTEYGKDGDCRKIDDSYFQQLKKYHPDYITSRLGFKLTILNMENNFLKENDLKAVWNRDTGAYYYVHQGALKKYNTKDRAVLMLVEDKFRKDGKIEINNEMLKDLPVLDF